MSLKIIHKHSSVEGQPPASTDLANGELGVNLNANDPALYLKDSNGAIRRLAGENSASFPEAPDDGKQYARESKSWQVVADKGVQVGDNPPADPTEGALWYDSGDTTALYIWYTDNDSSQWVPVAPDSGGGSGGGASVTTSANPPAGAVEGDMWWDSSDGADSNGGRLYLFYDGQWVQTSNVGGVLDSGGGGTSYWDRTGTTLSPTNAGDDVDLGTGDLSAAEGDFSRGVVAATGSTGRFWFYPDNTVDVNAPAVDGGGIRSLDVQQHLNFSTTSSGTDINFFLAGGANSGRPTGEFTINRWDNTDNNDIRPFWKGECAGVNNDRLKIQGYNAHTQAVGLELDPNSGVKIGGDITGGSPNITLNANGLIYTPKTFDYAAVDFGGVARPVYVEAGGALGYRSSSIETKANIDKIDGAVSFIKKLRPVQYSRRKRSEEGKWLDETFDRTEYGFIAEEVASFAPDSCYFDKLEDESEKVVGIERENFIAPLVSALQTALTRIESLEAEVQALKGGN